jgi:hypothetical protein
MKRYGIGDGQKPEGQTDQALNRPDEKRALRFRTIEIVQQKTAIPELLQPGKIHVVIGGIQWADSGVSGSRNRLQRAVYIGKRTQEKCGKRDSYPEGHAMHDANYNRKAEPGRRSVSSALQVSLPAKRL